LCSFLKLANSCSLTSLIFHSRLQHFIESAQIIEHLSSIIGQPSLVRLGLRDDRLSRMMDRCQWPVQCKLRYLRMQGDTGKTVSRMINRLPDLETLALYNRSESLIRFSCGPEDWFSASCPRLTSLTLLSFSLDTDELQSAFSHTSSLRHLKIITSSHDLINGSRWEQLIKTQLLFLNKFEFYARSDCCSPEENNPEVVLNEMIAPFRTPFWTEEKRWLVICNIFPTRREAEAYTSPICVSQYSHIADSKTMTTISNFKRENQHSTMLETVNELSVHLGVILADDLGSKLHHFSTLLSHDQMCLSSVCVRNSQSYNPFLLLIAIRQKSRSFCLVFR
jgi:hypothetical protein